MTICRKKRIVKKKLCRGDLRHRIQIMRRRLQSAGYDDLDGIESFTNICYCMAAIESVKGTTRFANVNINERPTHLFYILYNPVLDALDHGNNFIKFKTRFYRVLDLENSDEDNQFIIIQTTERGLDTQEANHA